MAVVRAAGSADLDPLWELLAKAGSALSGLTNLLGNRDRLATMLEASEAAFSAPSDQPGGESYLFVLEAADGTLVGTAGLISAVGLSDTFYSYRVGKVVKSSPRHGVHNSVPVLHLSNDHTGSAELFRLYLDPSHRHGGNGRLLSLSRLLFVADHPDRIAKRIIAELRGVLRNDGSSPFWEGLTSHFLGMSFAQADELSGSGDKSFIAELMPAQPIYVSLLRPETQDAIGRTHPETLGARAMLEAEGFRYRGYVDIFDGGPTVEADVADLRIVKESEVGRVVIDTPDPAITARALFSNRALVGFRSVATVLDHDGDEVRLGPDVAASLQVQPGDTVRFMATRPTSRSRERRDHE